MARGARLAATSSTTQVVEEDGSLRGIIPRIRDDRAKLIVAVACLLCYVNSIFGECPSLDPHALVTCVVPWA